MIKSNTDNEEVIFLIYDHYTEDNLHIISGKLISGSISIQQTLNVSNMTNKLLVDRICDSFGVYKETAHLNDFVTLKLKSNEDIDKEYLLTGNLLTNFIIDPFQVFEADVSFTNIDSLIISPGYSFDLVFNCLRIQANIENIVGELNENNGKMIIESSCQEEIFK